MKQTTATTTWACDLRTTTLPCGCVELDERKTFDVPRSEGDIACDKCGKYHYGKGGLDQLKYQDCPAHAGFFRKWKGIDRNYKSGRCPQFGISASEARSLLDEEVLDGEQWSEEERWELVHTITSSDERLSSNYCFSATANKFLSQEMLEELAFRVSCPYWARAFLKKAFVEGAARRHLEWMVRRWQFAFWGIRLAVVLATIVVWVWHVPDWRTLATLAVSSCAVAVMLPSFRALFLEWPIAIYQQPFLWLQRWFT